MKKSILILCLSLFTSMTFAQRYAIVDSKAILEKMPEYKKAQDQLDGLSAKWESEIKVAFDKVEKMYKTYQAESSMLDDKMKRMHEDEIIREEKKAKDLQKQYFGYDGQLFKKKEELIKPIQDKIYNAIQQLATKNSYDFILDKSAGVTVFYINPKIEITNEVCKSLGIN